MKKKKRDKTNGKDIKNSIDRITLNKENIEYLNLM